MYDLVIIGGGAAGFFAALTFLDKVPYAKILMVEKTSCLLEKVLRSGGGRCNLTHALLEPKDFSKNYPRGNRELLAPFCEFGAKETIDFFESKGVFLKIEEDGRVFPKSNSSKTIVNFFLQEAKRLSLEILLNQKIKKVFKEEGIFLLELVDKKIKSKNILLATGGSDDGFEIAKSLNHTIQNPIPSLFAFSFSSYLQELSGLVLKDVKVSIKDSSFFQRGSLLITHFGISGPVVLNLSSFGARYLFEKKYKVDLGINFLPDLKEEEIFFKLLAVKKIKPQKILFSENIFHFPKSFWKCFLDTFSDRFKKRLYDISKKDLKELSLKLHQDSFSMEGKKIQDEFVTAGGINLKEVNFKTMESKILPSLFFAGEILDIDGITGGFNLQNAWTTGFIAALELSRRF